MKTALRVLVAVSMVVLVASTVCAQSSGNFAAEIQTVQCAIGADGTLSGGGVTVLDTTIKTPNSGSTALLIRPSLIIGLFTKSKATATNPSDTAVAGAKVKVTIDGNPVSPDTGNGVYFAKRFQQLSTGLFNVIEACIDDPNDSNCFIELITSTLSAHSFDFVATGMGGGVHEVVVSVELDPEVATDKEAVCVGPGVVTVQQVKTFSQSGGVEIQ